MAFLKVDKEKVTRRNRSGIVYILIMVIDGYEIYKIGVTERASVKDRVLELAASHLDKYRFVPYIYPKRFRKTTDIYEKEKILHEYFSACKYQAEKKVDGGTEHFEIDDQEHLLDVYARVLNGEELEGKYVPKD